jgi:small GTP-binding protein
MPQMSPNDVTKKNPPVYKIIILGESNVGKSSLFLRYTEDLFKEALANTIGINNCFKELFIDGNPVHLQMWDTAGQERFRSIVSAFYRESDGFILVYDVTMERSYHYLTQLISELSECIDPKFTILVGNKTDQLSQDKLFEEYDKLASLAKKHKFKYYFTSAKTGENVNELFEELSRDLYYNKVTQSKPVNKIIFNKPKGNRNSKCC